MEGTVGNRLRPDPKDALRWKDADWKAGLIRVRRNYTPGRFGTPKTKRSSRAVPMPNRVAAALKEHFKRSHYTGADDLVFCHPETGGPDASKMRKRFKDAIEAAGVRSIRPTIGYIDLAEFAPATLVDLLAEKLGGPQGSRR